MDRIVKARLLHELICREGGRSRAKGCQTGRGSREVATLSKLEVEPKKSSGRGGREVIGVRVGGSNAETDM